MICTQLESECKRLVGLNLIPTEEDEEEEEDGDNDNEELHHGRKTAPLRIGEVVQLQRCISNTLESINSRAIRSVSKGEVRGASLLTTFFSLMKEKFEPPSFTSPPPTLPSSSSSSSSSSTFESVASSNNTSIKRLNVNHFSFSEKEGSKKKKTKLTSTSTTTPTMTAMVSGEKKKDMASGAMGSLNKPQQQGVVVTVSREDGFEYQRCIL
jgi:hypothetical protein